MYKLINPKGTIHDFAHKMRWGHNIEDIHGGIPYKFDELETQEFNWHVFHYLPIKTGDFIIRNMVSGRVGVYEVILSEQDNCGSPFGPKDLYLCKVRFCGYYDKNRRVSTIFNGYGIHTSWLDKLPWRKK